MHDCKKAGYLPFFYREKDSILGVAPWSALQEEIFCVSMRMVFRLCLLSCIDNQ